MLRVAVCVGSACHLRGSGEVIRILQDLISAYGLEDQVNLEGSFCHSRCTGGIVMHIDDELITGVRKDTVFRLFQDKILRRCRP
ncbi:MAG: (2Fe-2S) ferredoxin domain-containing protein [Firmicutes bacterium]|nr:(2Fe-2S) ferredoxin domain-containing protein [Bacillota bacterium]